MENNNNNDTPNLKDEQITPPSAPAPQPQPEDKPEVKAEEKTEDKQETKPETKTQPKQEEKTEPKAPQKPKAVPAPVIKPAPAPVAAPKTPAKNPYVVALVVLFMLSLIANAYTITTKPPSKPIISQEDASDEAGAFLSNVRASTKEGIGWINIRGAITTASGPSSPFERRTENFAQRIKKLAERKNVKAIVLDINSPGGTVGACQEIYDTILEVKEKHKKPVIALFRDMSASGGYYIAAACDYIIAQPGTMTGSIGVILQTGDYVSLLEKIGVKFNVIKSGKFKDMGSGSRSMTAEEKALLQDLIDDTYKQFFDAVKAGRKNIPEDKLKTLTDGRLFTGRQAFENGLVDALGGTDKAIEEAKKLGNISAENPAIVTGNTRMGSLFSLLEATAAKTSPAASIKEELGIQPGLSYLWVQ